jgi:hypothetical protein
MQVNYDWLRKGLSRVPKQLTVVIGLLALPITTRLEKAANVAKPLPPKSLRPAPPADPRAVRLTKFFSRLHCPVIYLAGDFIRAADDNQLDWRLLPSISVIESGGGKAYRNNNIFGWDNGNRFFPSIRAGLNEVAYKLGKSPLYKRRDVMGKLRIYNPDESYATNVMTVMNRISPVVNLKQVRQPNAFVYATD